MSTTTIPKSIQTQDAQANQDTMASMQAAFEVFARQSHQLETAYLALKQDLARSNKELQERNRQLMEKNQELARVSGRLECVVESLTDGLLAVGTDTRVEHCNVAAAGILGIMDRAIEAVPIHELIPDTNILNAITAILNGGNAVLDIPWQPTSPDGDTREILISLAPIRTTSGTIIGIVCNLRDHTELRRLQKRLQSHERLAALGEMAASVAHEIRNPLGTIEGFARLLRRDLVDMPDHLRLAEKIVAGAQNLNYVITNLLTYARPMHIQLNPVSVATLFATCKETLEQIAANRDVKLALLPPENDVSFNGDIRQMAQAILNLGINAIEASQPGQTVQISANRTQHSALIRIQDHGCGMTPQTLDKIFDPFFTQKEAGTGLGLSLTKKILDAHGGDLSVTSTPGKGTTFILQLAPTGEHV